MRRAILMTAVAALIGGAAYAWQISEPPDMETVTYVATVEAGDTVWDLAARLAWKRATRCGISRRALPLIRMISEMWYGRSKRRMASPTRRRSGPVRRWS